MKEEAISVEAGIIEETVIAKQQWAIPEKIQTQGWGYAFSRRWNFQGWPKKNNVEFPVVFVFGLGIAKGSNAIL